MKRQNLLRDLDPMKPDWSKTLREVARDLGVSIATAHRLKESYRKRLKGPRRLEAEIHWTLETLDRCARVEAQARKHFGKLVKGFREKHGLSQKELARLAFGPHTERNRELCLWESGKALPDRTEITWLAETMKRMNPCERTTA